MRLSAMQYITLQCKTWVTYLTCPSLFMLCFWLDHNLNHVSKVRERFQHLGRSKFQLVTFLAPGHLVQEESRHVIAAEKSSSWSDWLPALNSWVTHLGARQATQRGWMVVMYSCTAREGLKQTRCLHTHLSPRTQSQFHPINISAWHVPFAFRFLG